MNRRNDVVTLADDRQCGKLGMQRDPSASEELIEDVVLLTITVHKAGTDDMNAEATISLLLKSQCALLKLLQGKVFRQGHAAVEVRFGIGI